ncbi:prolyl oligopeptidase family serine peptidase [Acidothermaceae bacterium B102]|nr:prolyl oligopeptidase family serine peptidase [Acidothermaceae bacterium B102]
MSLSPEQPLSFPRHSARTQRFTLGQPRSVAVADDGARVVFLRSAGGTDPANALWVYDVAAGSERLVADATVLMGAGDDDVPPEERARRERLRESAGGIVAYAMDPGATVASFALSGRLFLADLIAGSVSELPTAGPVIDPRVDPTGTRIAYVSGAALHVVEVGGASSVQVAGEDDEQVGWGMAEFIAAEEMGRLRGYWWAPDGQRLVAARVDESPVQRWYIADPNHPERPAQEVGYPSAGTANAIVTAAIVDLDGGKVEIAWDTTDLPYLVTAGWPRGRSPFVVVQSRDQRRLQLLEVDDQTGATTLVREDADPIWVDIHPGVPAWLGDGRLVWLTDHDDTRGLSIGDDLVTPAGLQVSGVLGSGDDWVLIEASDEPTESHVYRWSVSAGLERVTTAPGLYRAVAGGDVLALASATLDQVGTLWTLTRAGAEIARLASFADKPSVHPFPVLLRTGSRELRTSLILPNNDARPTGPLPVLMNPYGGPHGQQVLAARSVHLSSQWLADQGFAVVVADGRGTPGRGPAWDRTVAFDLATPALEDQVDALHGVADQFPGELDLDRVAIRGWSFGGYLAALAVLRRPDVFHAAVAGAPVTDWALYDTHYTERYLGTPADQPDAYRNSSLLDDAAKLERPLMLVHGLADDNVVFAHTLRLSSALLAAGRAHTVLPLSGVTHMASQEAVAENLLLLQVEFLKAALS